MFKFLPRNPESPRSVIAAGFRLYFASFKYSLALVVSLALALTICYTGLAEYTVLNDVMVSFVTALVGLVFFIPIVKRIYSAGAGLPISTQHAFDGFFTHYVRLVIIVCLLNFLSLFMVIVMGLASFNIPVLIISSFLLVIAYFYIAIKIYFANMFVLLENKHIFDAFKSSIRIEHHHMWLTFWVLFVYMFSFFVILTFVNPHLNDTPLLQMAFNAAATIIGIPLFICVQICQFFNLKELRGN